MAKKAGRSAVSGFELFRSKIEDAIDYRNNHTPKPRWMSNEAAHELKKNTTDHNEAAHELKKNTTDHNVRPTHITSGGERVWSF